MGDKADAVEQHPSRTDGQHMLESGWTVWWDEGKMRVGDYADHLQNLGSFRSVEEFWNMYTSLSRPNQLHHMSHYRGFSSSSLFFSISNAKMLRQTFRRQKSSWLTLTRSRVAVFREGVLPMWEAFPTGGSWIVRFKKQVQPEIPTPWTPREQPLKNSPYPSGMPWGWWRG